MASKNKLLEKVKWKLIKDSHDVFHPSTFNKHLNKLHRIDVTEVGVKQGDALAQGMTREEYVASTKQRLGLDKMFKLSDKRMVRQGWKTQKLPVLEFNSYNGRPTLPEMSEEQYANPLYLNKVLEETAEQIDAARKAMKQ